MNEPRHSPLWQRLLWFALLWAWGVVTVAVVAYAIRFAMRF